MEALVILLGEFLFPTVALSAAVAAQGLGALLTGALDLVGLIVDLIRGTSHSEHGGKEEKPAWRPRRMAEFPGRAHAEVMLKETAGGRGPQRPLRMHLSAEPSKEPYRAPNSTASSNRRAECSVAS
jgi:hypothetical protein